MRREDIKVLQNAQLRILQYVDSVCRKLDINYFLMFGSLLGAIRHQGSIPWDVDIDIALFRADYEKLRQYCIERNDGRWFYQDYTTEKNHYAPHALVIDTKTHLYFTDITKIKYKKQHDGVYIDIFPIDETSSKPALQKKQIAAVMRLRYINNLKIAAIHKGSTGPLKKAVKRLVSFVLSPLSFRCLGKKLDAAQRRYEGVGTGQYTTLTSWESLKWVYPASFYDPVRYVPYENMKAGIPNKAEELLSRMYGDYMSLPSEENRWNYLETKIDSVVFDKDYN